MAFKVASKTLSSGKIDPPFDAEYETAEEAQAYIDRNVRARDSMIGVTRGHRLDGVPPRPDHFVFVVVDKCGNEVTGE